MDVESSFKLRNEGLCQLAKLWEEEGWIVAAAYSIQLTIEDDDGTPAGFRNIVVQVTHLYHFCTTQQMSSVKAMRFSLAHS